MEVNGKKICSLSVGMTKDVHANEIEIGRSKRNVERETAFETVSGPDNNYKGCN